MNIQIDIENFVELFTKFLNGQHDVVDVAKTRSLKLSKALWVEKLKS
jgi:hypothetical protein